MESLFALRICLAAAFIYAVIALGFMLARTARLGGQPLFARPVGLESAGIVYAFTRGMNPLEKDSSRHHMPTYVAGFLYHIATFISAILLILVTWGVSLPPGVLWFMRILICGGILSGVALLVKRMVHAQLRIISTYDDFLSNLLVDVFLATSLATTVWATAEPALLVSAILVLLYLPVGKIRHCVFYFYARFAFGRLFGRRGIFPRPASDSRTGAT